MSVNLKIPSNFLKAVFHKYYLVHSWIICLICLSDLISRTCFYYYPNFLSSYRLSAKSEEERMVE